MAGTQVNAAQVNDALGHMAADMEGLWSRVARMKVWMDTMTDIELEGIGFAVDDVALIRSSVNDLDALRAVYYGSAAVPAPKDFSVFLKRLAGPI
jgi:hypothetical protein